jgi:hypothetical protein
VLLLGSCDIRTEMMANGQVPYAPVKNGYGSEGSGPPACPPVLGCPSHGIVSSSASFGFGASTVFDLDKNTLAFVAYGHLTGAPTNIPEVPPRPRIILVSNADRNEIVRFANFAWAPSGPPPFSRGAVDLFLDITLIDGKIVKLMDGQGAGGKLAAALAKIGERYGLYKANNASAR